MSKVLGPLLSLSASQTFAGTVTYARSRGQNVVRLKSNPSNPKTSNQMEARAYLGAGGKISKAADPEGTLAMFIKPITPTTLTWANYLVRNMLGTSNATIKASRTAYETVGNATIKGYFDAAALEAGIQGVTLGSDPLETVPAGLALWGAYVAANGLQFPGASEPILSVSSGQVEAFTTALTGYVFE